MLSGLEERIIEKISSVGKPLKDWKIDIFRGILTGFNEAFIITTESKDKILANSPNSIEIIRPILRGRDIKRYSATFCNTWLLNTHNGIKEKEIPRIDVRKDFPAVFEHLSKFRHQLETRLDKGDDWTNLRNCAYLDELEKPKIIWIELTDNASFYLDLDGYYINNTVFFLTGERLPYLTAFLNSTLTAWYFTTIAATSGMGTRRWIKMYVDQIRVPEMTPAELEAEIDSLVVNIQQGKKRGVDTKAFEQRVDELIFSLIDFTQEEIEFIHSKVRENSSSGTPSHSRISHTN